VALGEHTAHPTPVPERSSADPPEVSHPDLPDSLRGSEVDGRLAVDAAGRLLPGPGLLQLFDYFLAASGEEPEAVLRDRIVRTLRSALPPLAAAEATKLLDQYLGFRNALRELALAGNAPESAERRLQWFRELRYGFFTSAESTALFGESDRVAEIDLERRTVVLDPELDEAQRANALAALDEALPEPVREARHRAGAPARVRDQVSELRAAGGSDREVYAIRERAFGFEAAERLAALDRQRADWKRRLASYAAERDALLRDPALEAEQRAAALEALRAERFSPDELARVRSLDSVAAIPTH
jgi:lipase chaperone LimK